MSDIKLRKKLGAKRIRQLYNLTSWIGYYHGGDKGDIAIDIMLHDRKTARAIQKILGVKFND